MGRAGAGGAPEAPTPGGQVPAALDLPTDVDECASGRGGCEHRCTNLAGSFRCSCEDGHLLDEDRRGCSRESAGRHGDPTFLAGRSPLQSCLSLWDRPGAAGFGGGAGQTGAPRQGVTQGPWSRLLPRPGESRDIVPGTEDSVQRDRELFLSPHPLLAQGPEGQQGGRDSRGRRGLGQDLRARSLLCPEK